MHTSRSTLQQTGGFFLQTGSFLGIPNSHVAPMSQGQERPNKKDAKLLSPEEIAGTWYGNGCCLSPECMYMEISPACGGGI